MNAALFIVASTRGLAIKHGVARGFGWLVVPVTVPPPDHLMTWETRSGAQKFADMNGGTVMTVLEYFYSSRQTDAALPIFD